MKISFMLTVGFLQILSSKCSGCCVDLLNFQQGGENGSYVAVCLASMLKSWKWDSITLISDRDDMSQMVTHFSSRYVSVLPIPTLTGRVGFRLKDRVTVGFFRIVVFCQFRSVLTLIEEAHSEGLFTRKYAWVFVITKSTGKENEKVEYFLRSLQLKLRPDSNIVLATADVCTKKEGTISIFKLSSQKNPPFYASRFPTIEFSCHNESYVKQNYEYDGPVNLKMRNLTIAAFHDPPFIIITKSGNISFVSGYMAEIMENLSNIHGFRFSYVLLKPASYGVPNSNGSWSGILGLLQQKVVDATAIGLAAQIERLAILEYSTYVATTAATIVIRNPQELNGRTFNCNTYFQPFNQSLWFMLLAMSFICLICLATTDWWGFQFQKRISLVFNLDEMAPKGERKQSFTTSLWEILTMSLRQGMKVLPYGNPKRILIIAGLMYGTLFALSYCSVLTAFLTVTKEDMPYRSLDDILADPSFRVAYLRTGGIFLYVQRSSFKAFRKLKQVTSKNPENLVDSYDEGLDRAYNQHFAFLGSRAVLKHRMKGNCDLVFLEQTYAPSDLLFAFQKNSPFTDIISRSLHKMRSSGVLAKLKNKYGLISTEVKCGDSGVVSQSIGIHQTVGALVAFCVGCMLAAISCSVEIAIKNYSVRNSES